MSPTKASKISELLSELNDSEYWRRRAARARAEAERTMDRNVKTKLLGFAEGNEKIARRIDKGVEK